MRRWLLIALCGLGLTGCVSVNNGRRPMGSIIGQTEAPSGQTVARELVAAVPGRR